MSLLRESLFPKEPIRALGTRTFLGEPDRRILSDPEYQEAIPALRSVYEQVWRWHGTGRYQYSNYGIRDVLSGIAESQGLVPHLDKLDYTQGPMYSISTSPSRLYASLYAQLHFEKGKRLRGPVSTAAGWAYFYGNLWVTAIKEDRRLFNSRFRQEHNLDKEGTRYFHDKYTKQPVSSWDIMQGGLSDIPHNYPIVIGFKKQAFEEIPIAPVLQRHESRSKTPIDLVNFTHLEVPYEQIEAARSDLEQQGITHLAVIPVEWTEEFCKSLPLAFLTEGFPLKHII